jgi:hypothetical protein
VNQEPERVENSGAPPAKGTDTQLRCVPQQSLSGSRSKHLFVPGDFNQKIVPSKKAEKSGLIFDRAESTNSHPGPTHFNFKKFESNHPYSIRHPVFFFRHFVKAQQFFEKVHPLPIEPQKQEIGTQSFYIEPNLP